MVHRVFVMKHVFIGTSGYNYKDWKGKFYPSTVPQKNWLEYYSKHFSTLEVNAAFYRSFPKITYQKWASQVPKHFQFAIKGSRFITHLKRLSDVESSVQLFFDGVEGLGEKLKVVLWQFPKNFKGDEENVNRFKNFLL